MRHSGGRGPVGLLRLRSQCARAALKLALSCLPPTFFPMATASATAQRTDAVLREVVRLFLQAQRSLSDCCSDATAKECEALLLLAREAPLTVQAFAGEMGLEKTWASRLLVRLEKQGYIRRKPNPADGRSLLVELTTKGSAEQRRLAQGIGSQAHDLLCCVPPGERANLERALVTLRDALTSCLANCSSPRAPTRRSKPRTP